MIDCANQAITYPMAAFDWRNIAACLFLEIEHGDDLYDADGNLLGWMRHGKPVLEFEPGAYQLGDEIVYYDRTGARLGALRYTLDAVTD